MAQFETALAASFAAFQRSDHEAALSLLGPWRRSHAHDPRLAAMLGQVLLADGDPLAAIAPLRTALAAAPENVPLRSKLAFALIGAGRPEDARSVAAAQSGPQLQRIVAFVDQRTGDAARAINGFRDVIRALPGDYESWHNLGLLLLETGELGGAIDSIAQAVALAPGEAPYRLTLSRALAEAARLAERLDAMLAAVAALPGDAAVRAELAAAYAGVDDLASAEATYRIALGLDPHRADTYRDFGLFLDRIGRIHAIEALLTEARARAVPAEKLAFLEALVCQRRGDPGAARRWLSEVAVDAVAPARVAELRGEIADRLGDSAEAFAAYSEMNGLTAATPLAQHALAMNFLGEVEQAIEALDQDIAMRWRVDRDPPSPSPVFILGFPRSGTTLLDTLLRNLPGTSVLEEPPMIERVAEQLRGMDLATIDTQATEAARASYFRELAAFDPEAGGMGKRIVDKFPLHMVRATVIHRLFPNAKLVFVERDPRDVMLSCFFARFQPNKAMVNFLTLDSSARLYDRAAVAWSRAEASLPLIVHRIRYERMIADLEGEMRALLAFLGVPWTPAVLDNQRAAAARSHVATASYAQVGQPLYSRSVSRWRRYRHQLEPILPLLAPWVARLGYQPD